jgi:DNA-binding beta-propeller fold protein YncE
MKTPSPAFPMIACALLACGSEAGLVVPNGESGVGFDDLRYSTHLHRVLAPSGRAGVIALVDPDSGTTSRVNGFSTSGSYDGGHDFGVTSVDEGGGFLFATDRTSGKVYVIDDTALAIVGSADLTAGPDYVRWVAATNELWVSEPSGGQIEIFSVSRASPPTLTHAGAIGVDNGPESLVIDVDRGRAYTHHWESQTLAIDLKTRAVIATFDNGCAASRGIDVEPEHGFLLAACNEGTVSVIDAMGTGKIVSSIAKGAGYDVMGYSRSLRHLYLAGTACGCMTTLGLTPDGRLSYLGRTDAPSDAHCAVADDVGNAWVCSPSNGRIIQIHDPYPPTK